MAYNCPKKNLHLGVDDGEQFECERDDEDSHDFGDYLDDLDAENTLTAVVRRILITPKLAEEDWRRTSIFQMLVHCGNQAHMLILTLAAA